MRYPVIVVHDRLLGLRPVHSDFLEWQHITDHDLERYYLGMVKDETERPRWKSISLLAGRAPSGLTKPKTT